MDQFNQSSNNDLQRAIDEISGSGDASVQGGDNMQVNLGEPPAPQMDDFGMPPANGAEVNPPEPTTQGAESTPTIGGDLSMVRESALKELVPIIDKAGLSPDRQFGIVMAVIDSTRDKSFVPKALEAARNIADEKLRAEALLKIVSAIDS